MQTASAVALPAVVSDVPAGHTDHGVQLAWLSVAENEPPAHAAQTRSAVALPALATEVPAAQVDHAVQLAWLAAAENVPAAHGAQVRSLVALPSEIIEWPARHVVCATHAVLGSESWSQVPAAHATAAAEPPAQKLPAEHAAHVGDDVAVPGAVWISPARHAPAGRHIDWLGPEVNRPAPQGEHV